MVLCMSVVPPATNRDAFLLWLLTSGCPVLETCPQVKFFTDPKTNALFLSGCCRSVLGWAPGLALPCCSAVTGIPLCQQLYALSNNVACFGSFLVDSLHMSSGRRKLLLNIISPLSHFWSLILALTCGDGAVLQLAPQFSWTIEQQKAGDYLVTWPIWQLSAGSHLLQCIYTFESAHIFEFAKVTLQTAFSVLEIIVLSHCAYCHFRFLR